MLTVALDTNVVTKILRGDHSDIDPLLARIDTFYIPWAVYAELLSGIAAGSNPAKYTPLLESFLDKSYVIRSTTLGSRTVPHYAEIYATLRKQGTPVSPNDMWIAAECAAEGIALLTLDTDFKNIPQVLRFN